MSARRLCNLVYGLAYDNCEDEDARRSLDDSLAATGEPMTKAEAILALGGEVG